jgi:hypothetical protein
MLDSTVVVAWAAGEEGAAMAMNSADLGSAAATASRAARKVPPRAKPPASGSSGAPASARSTTRRDVSGRRAVMSDLMAVYGAKSAPANPLGSPSGGAC